MRITLRELRSLIRRALLAENGVHFPGQPARNALSPDINTREQLGSLADKGFDTADDPEGEHLPPHLRDVTVSPESCYGPVPPDSDPPYVGQDPFARMTSPTPFSGGGSIKRG